MAATASSARGVRHDSGTAYGFGARRSARPSAARPSARRYSMSRTSEMAWWVLGGNVWRPRRKYLGQSISVHDSRWMILHCSSRAACAAENESSIACISAYAPPNRQLARRGTRRTRSKTSPMMSVHRAYAVVAKPIGTPRRGSTGDRPSSVRCHEVLALTLLAELAIDDEIERSRAEHRPVRQGHVRRGPQVAAVTKLTEVEARRLVEDAVDDERGEQCAPRNVRPRHMVQRQEPLVGAGLDDLRARPSRRPMRRGRSWRRTRTR